MTSITPSQPHWTSWPLAAKLKLLAEAKWRIWLKHARPEQLPPDDAWRTWYLRGGRGSGKTRAGAELLARLIFTHEPGDWMIVAPTNPDAKRCVEMAKSGLISVLGGLNSPLIRDWNRGEGTLHLTNGAKVHTDGANDGAARIQGYNLSGAWCDEVGLWEKWDLAWNWSLRPAIRVKPSLIIATGTPKMGHGLVKQLLNDPRVPCAVMRTIDNLANLDDEATLEMISDFEGTTLGRQELEGHYIEALEGALLSRFDWRWYEAQWQVEDEVGHLDDMTARIPEARHGKFERIVHSWDTTWKAKATSDFVAGQAWGVSGANRSLLAIFHKQATLEQAIAGMLAMRAWTQKHWPDTRQDIIIENATWGPEAYAVVRQRVGDTHKIQARGDKAARAFTASSALETHTCHLPGEQDSDPLGKGYTQQTPAQVQTFVEECSEFDPVTMRQNHDDQVDAWSQMVNWTRGRKQRRPTRLARPSGGPVRPGTLSGV